MADTKEELLIVARLKDQVSPGLKVIDRNSRAWSSRMRRYWSRVSAAAGGFRKALFSIRGALLAIGAGVALASVGRLTASLIQSAAAAEELNAKFDIVFGEGAEAADEFARALSGKTGRAIQQIKNGLATFQDTFVPMGLAREDAAELSKALIQASQDVASFNEKNDADVIRDFQSALVGNSETVRKYGILITEAAIEQRAWELGINKSSAQLSQQEKLLIRTQLLFDGMTDAIGTAEREVDTFAGRMRTLGGVIEDTQIDAGSRLKEIADQAITDAGGVQAIADFIRLVYDSAVAAGEQFIRVAASMFRKITSSIQDLGGPNGVIARVEIMALGVGGTMKIVAAGVIGIVEGLDTATRASVEFLGAMGLLDTEKVKQGWAIYAQLQATMNAAGKEQSLLMEGLNDYADALVRISELPIDVPGLSVTADFSDASASMDLEALLDRMASGLTDQTEKVKKAAFSMAAGLEAAKSSGLDSFTGALYDIGAGARSAKDAMSDFLRSTIAQLAQLQLKQIFAPLFGVQTLTPGLSLFADGGIIPGGLGNAMPVHGYANGGAVFNKPHVAVIGEGRYNEAAVPLPDGRRIPVDLGGTGGEGGGSTSVNFTVNAVDAGSVLDLLANQGEGLAAIIAQQFSASPVFRAQISGGGLS